MGGPCSAEQRQEEFDRLVEAFEAAWQRAARQNGPPPSLGAHLPAVADHEGPAGASFRRQLLEEFIKIDLEYHWRRPRPREEELVTVSQLGAGPRAAPRPFPERPRVEDYVERFPELGRRAELPVALIAEEYRVRQRWGDDPGSAEFAARFPEHGAALRDALARIDADLAIRTALHTTPQMTDTPLTRSAGVSLSCPSCRTPIALDAEPTPSVRCPICGDTFNVADYAAAPRDGTRPPVPRVGRYELETFLGMGGFGTVWRARDVELGRAVAVKLPRHGQFPGPNEEERFLRDARFAAQLHHPGIVAVHDVSRERGAVYIVSELVEGVDLAKSLSARRFPFGQVAELVAQVADALDYAHRQGVVHRDVKPSNILLEEMDEAADPSTWSGNGLVPLVGARSPDRAALVGARSPDRASVARGTGGRLDVRPRVIDFGLAKRQKTETTLTLDGNILGTPAYMSPEQARGDGRGVDGRTDIYSLGVVLYELLTGERPFGGLQEMLLLQVLHDEPKPPRKLNGKVPRDLETICLKCLEKEPARRYPTAGELAADLRRWLAGEPILARPVGRSERLWRWCRRKPMIASLALALALAVVGGVAGVTWKWLAEREQRGRAEEGWRIARGRWYLSDMNLAEYYRLDANLPSLLDILNRHRPEAGADDPRGFEWYNLHRACHAERLTLTHHAREVTCLAAAPDGRTWASAGLDASVRLWHWDGQSCRQQANLRVKAPALALAFAPDGKTLAAATKQGVILWDVGTGQEQHQLAHGGARAVAFAPDGRTLASAGTDANVRFWDLTEAKPRLRGMVKAQAIIRCLAFAPDGKLLAAGCQNGTVGTIDPTAAVPALESLFKADGVMVTAVAFGAGGKRLAASTGHENPLAAPGLVYLWDMDRGQLQGQLAGHASAVWAVAFAKDGKALASAGQDRTVRVWETDSGQELAAFRGHLAAVWAVVFTADGQTLISGSTDKSVKLWDTDRPSDRRPVKTHEGDVWAVAFSPDSQVFATGGQDHDVQFWKRDRAGWRKGERLAGHKAAIRSLAFGPEGKTLVTGGDEGKVRVWKSDGVRWREQDALPGQAGAEKVWSVALSRDGKTLAAGAADATVKVWRWTDDRWQGPTTWRVPEMLGGPKSVALAHDGTLLAAAGLKYVQVWDLAAQKAQPAVTLPREAVVWSLAFSPDGRTLAAASDNQTLQLFHRDGAAWREEALGSGPRGLKTLAFAPDGKVLVTGSDDGTVRLWDSAFGQERIIFKENARFRCVAFAPNGRTLVAGGTDGKVKLWEASTEAEARSAER